MHSLADETFGPSSDVFNFSSGTSIDPFSEIEIQFLGLYMGRTS